MFGGAHLTEGDFVERGTPDHVHPGARDVAQEETRPRKRIARVAVERRRLLLLDSSPCSAGPALVATGAREKVQDRLALAVRRNTDPELVEPRAQVVDKSPGVLP